MCGSKTSLKYSQGLFSNLYRSQLTCVTSMFPASFSSYIVRFHGKERIYVKVNIHIREAALKANAQHSKVKSMYLAGKLRGQLHLKAQKDI